MSVTPYGELAGDIDDPIRGLIRAIPNKTEGFKLEILLARGRADRAALARAMEIEVDKILIPIVKAEDLIAMKLEAGGGQDFEDVRRLLQVRAGTIDEKLLAASCAERKVSEKLALVRSRR